MDTKLWTWTSVQVENQIYEAPFLWSHESVLVNGDIVVFSEEKKCPYCSCPIKRYTIPRTEPSRMFKIFFFVFGRIYTWTTYLWLHI